MVVAANRYQRLQVAVLNEPIVERAHDAQAGISEFTDQRRRRTTDMCWLEGAQCKCHVRDEWRTQNVATVAVHPRGKIDREHRRSVANVRGDVRT
jgi:hypothetical protein